MTILVAGIGNIFQGDDGFGSAVARKLAGMALPDRVQVMDFGIRGIDLTYALMDGHEVVILVDAAMRGEKPGTISLIECAPPADGTPEAPVVSMHDLDPARVMQLAAALGGTCRRVLLVACEPADLGGEEGRMSLSPPVEAAVGAAAKEILRLVTEITRSRPAA